VSISTRYASCWISAGRRVEVRSWKANFLKPSSARPLPSGETACGVLWVGPGDLLLLEGLHQLLLFKSCRNRISVMTVTVARDSHHPDLPANLGLRLVPAGAQLPVYRNRRPLPPLFLHSFLSKPKAVNSFGDSSWPTSSPIRVSRILFASRSAPPIASIPSRTSPVLKPLLR